MQVSLLFPSSTLSDSFYPPRTRTGQGAGEMEHTRRGGRRGAHLDDNRLREV
jgi:hypothetical protein